MFHLWPKSKSSITFESPSKTPLNTISLLWFFFHCAPLHCALYISFHSLFSFCNCFRFMVGNFWMDEKSFRCACTIFCMCICMLYKFYSTCGLWPVHCSLYICPVSHKLSSLSFHFCMCKCGCVHISESVMCNVQCKIKAPSPEIKEIVCHKIFTIVLLFSVIGHWWPLSVYTVNIYWICERNIYAYICGLMDTQKLFEWHIYNFC